MWAGLLTSPCPQPISFRFFHRQFFLLVAAVSSASRFPNCQITNPPYKTAILKWHWLSPVNLRYFLYPSPPFVSSVLVELDWCLWAQLGLFFTLFFAGWVAYLQVYFGFAKTRLGDSFGRAGKSLLLAYHSRHCFYNNLVFLLIFIFLCIFTHLSLPQGCWCHFVTHCPTTQIQVEDPPLKPETPILLWVYHWEPSTYFNNAKFPKSRG